MSKTLAAAAGGDIPGESNETFFVSPSAAVNATLSDAQGLGTLPNDD